MLPPRSTPPADHRLAAGSSAEAEKRSIAAVSSPTTCAWPQRVVHGAGGGLVDAATVARSSIVAFTTAARLSIESDANLFGRFTGPQRLPFGRCPNPAGRSSGTGYTGERACRRLGGGPARPRRHAPGASFAAGGADRRPERPEPRWACLQPGPGRRRAVERPAAGCPRRSLGLLRGETAGGCNRRGQWHRQHLRQWSRPRPCRHRRSPGAGAGCRAQGVATTPSLRRPPPFRSWRRATPPSTNSGGAAAAHLWKRLRDGGFHHRAGIPAEAARGA